MYTELKHAIEDALVRQYTLGYKKAKEECGIKWYKFPYEKPESHKAVLFVHTGHRFADAGTTVGEYMEKKDSFLDYRFMEIVPGKNVKRWAEVPQYDEDL